MFIAFPPKYAISQVIQRMEGRSSYRVQQEFRQFASAIGGAISGPRATSQPLPTTSYFSILRTISQILPTPVG